MFIKNLSNVFIKGTKALAKSSIVESHKYIYKFIDTVINPNAISKYYGSIANNPANPKYLRVLANTNVQLGQLLAGMAK